MSTSRVNALGASLVWITMQHRYNRQPNVDLPTSDKKANSAVLRQAFFSDVQFCHDFQATDDCRPKSLNFGRHRLNPQHTVNAIANAQSCTRRSKALAVLAALALVPGISAATDPGNVVEDGQFVLGQPRNPFSTYSAGQTVGGWKVDVGTIDVNVGYFAVPDEQSYSVDLNGTSAGGISQVLETVPGKLYTVKFMLSGNWDVGTSNRTFSLTAGPLRRSLSVARPASWSRTNMRWRTMTYSFLATSASSTLSFRSTTTAGPCGAVIANVSVSTPVDAPKALETIPVPTPPDLEKYVANKDAAIALGKLCSGICRSAATARQPVQPVTGMLVPMRELGIRCIRGHRAVHSGIRLPQDRRWQRTHWRIFQAPILI